MRKMIQKLVLVMVVAVALSGCAATDMRVKRGGSFDAYQDITKETPEDKVYWDMLIEAPDGVSARAPIKEYKGYKSTFPRDLEEEVYIPERIKWFVLIFSDARRYFGQIIRWKPEDAIECICELLIDGMPAMSKDAKGIIISTRGEKVFGFEENAKAIPVNRNHLMSDESYQKELVEKYGSQISDFSPSDVIIRATEKWTWYDTTRGLIANPWAKGRFRQIVSINPGYTYSQRLAVQPWVISTNLPGMVLNGVINNIRSVAMEPNTEWRSINQTAQEE